MEFRAAAAHDLPQLKSVYRAIIQNMNSNQIDIWDDVYPCEFFDKDVENDRLYVLLIHDEIVSAFVLCGTSAGEKMVEWKDVHGKALYLEQSAKICSHISPIVQGPSDSWDAAAAA